VHGRKPAHCACGGSCPRCQGVPAAPPSVPATLAAPGHPLDPSTRAFFEPRFGQDFSAVRVHAGPVAAQSARDVNAHAYTVGNHIVFGADRLAPSASPGRRLLAHELTHVVQQSGGGPAGLQQAPAMIQRDDAGGGSTEFEDRVEDEVVWETEPIGPPPAPLPVDPGFSPDDRLAPDDTRPTRRTGAVSGRVTRIETAPASDSQPREEVHRGSMNVRFDPADCSVTIPVGYRFVQADQASGTGICDEPPATTAVAPLPDAAFSGLKASVLEDINQGLNDWFDVHLSGSACPSGCGDRALPIRVVAREDDGNWDRFITVVNRGGRANAGTICAASWDRSTAVHEGAHQALGVGDEYPETDERLRSSVPDWFRPERVRRDYSAMGPEQNSRFAMFHERHFNAVKAFLEHVFPGCAATLQARSRPVIPDFRVTLNAGFAQLNGASGYSFGVGASLGIPLDRLRNWELVLGPRFSTMYGLAHDQSQQAFLLGARLGLEASTGGAGHGFVAGTFVESGLGWFDSRDRAPGGGGNRSTTAAYGEFGLGAGYRTPLLDGLPRFNIGVEGAAGTAFGAPGIVGPITREIETDPARSHWFRLGLSLGWEL
jgi:Domain of unknown function (DUF4157)